MILMEKHTKADEDLKKGIDKLEKKDQVNLNNRLDKMRFSYVSSQQIFDSEKPHKNNIISFVQYSQKEVHLYKGDKRILFGNKTNHGIIVPNKWEV